MLSSIPASNIVTVNPAVIGIGGSALSLNTVVLSDISLYPVSQYASAADVGNAFGYSSSLYKFAQCSFDGYIGSTIKPASLFIARYSRTDIRARLIGASVKSLQLDDLRAINGGITLTIDGVITNANIDLSNANSFSDAAVKISASLKTEVNFDTQLQAFVI